MPAPLIPSWSDNREAPVMSANETTAVELLQDRPLRWVRWQSRRPESIADRLTHRLKRHRKNSLRMAAEA